MQILIEIRKMKYYKKIFESLPFPCILFEINQSDFVIKEVNASYSLLTNTIAEELVNKNFNEVFTEDSIGLGLKDFHDSLQLTYKDQSAHKIDAVRFHSYKKLGKECLVKWWEIENIPISYNNENKGFILSIINDITHEFVDKFNYKYNQEKLKITQEYPHQLIEKITDGLFSLDIQGNFKSLNNGLLDIAEVSEVDLLKMSFLQFCALHHKKEIVSKFKAAIEGENQKFEADFISATGRKMNLEISLVPLKSQNRITGLYGIAKDLTRFKKSEEAFTQSERKFKALVQEGSDLIGILDLEGKYKFVSETARTILGIQPIDFIGKNSFDYIHPQDKVRVMEKFSCLESTNRVQIEPFRFKNANEEWRWIETVATNLTDDPAVNGIVVNSRDVTKQINSQKAILESEERYRSLFENSIDAIMIAIPGGKILAANPSACRMFQRNEEEIIQAENDFIIDSQDSILSDALNIRKEKGIVNKELTFIRKDGTRFPGEMTSTIFKDSDGNHRSSIIIRDITKRKFNENNLLKLNKDLNKSTQELIIANKGLEQFSYIISHNLRAPIANIIGLTQLLKERDYSEEIKMNLRDEIHSNTNRMDKVIRDLNKIIQVKNDFSEIKQMINLQEIVDSIKISLEDSIKKERIFIITDFEAIDKVRSVKGLIYSIFYNLILNSIKFRKLNGSSEINISSIKENGMVQLIFKDNGLGLDISKKRDEIFGLYKRFHNHVEGKGMGLFMVKTQVEMLGGKIKLVSEVNKGATFIIEFDIENFE